MGGKKTQIAIHKIKAAHGHDVEINARETQQHAKVPVELGPIAPPLVTTWSGGATNKRLGQSLETAQARGMSCGAGQRVPRRHRSVGERLLDYF